MDRAAKYTLKHKDEESGHLVNVSDYNSLQNNEKVTIILKKPVVQVPLQPTNENAGRGEGEENASGPEDDNLPGNEVAVTPRVDLGTLPTLYQLPTFPADIIRKIQVLGRRIHPDTREEIVNILRKDMMQYSCFAYPKSFEYNRVVEKLVTVYPSLQDVVTTGGQTHVWFSWKCDLASCFNKYRRSNGHSNPAIEECRVKLGYQNRKRPSGGARTDKAGDRAKRFCDPTCLEIPIEEGIVPDNGTTEEIRGLLVKEWEKTAPNVNLIILRLNLTAAHRRSIFKSGEVSHAIGLYPPLKDPFHIFNDMERFFDKNVVEMVKEYLTLERCDRAIRTLRTSTQAKDITEAYLKMPNYEELEVKRDYVLAALPALTRKEHISKWILVGKEPKGVGAIIRADSESSLWLDSNFGSYTIVVDGERFSGTQGEFSLTEAVCCCMSLMFLFDLKFPLYVTGAWRFLAEHICGLPSAAKTVSSATQLYINLLD